MTGKLEMSFMGWFLSLNDASHCLSSVRTILHNNKEIYYDHRDL